MATIVGRKKKGATLPIVVSTSPRGNNPQCIVLPVVTGTATIGSTVVVSQGTWLNNPGTFYYQWQRNLSDIPGAVFTNYTLQSADLNQSITCLVTAWNINGNGIARTVPFIPIAGGGGGSTIDAPVLSNPTNTGQWDTTLDATVFVGDSIHLLIFSDSGLTTQVQHLVKMITPDEMAGGGGASNWSILATPPPRDATTGVITGLAMGVGPRWWYEYIQRDDGTTSPNSNVLNATIVATVGTLPNLQVWLDPSDLSTMFQSGTRASPGPAVAADGDPVGLILDKSGNGNDFMQATAGQRPIYHTAAGINKLSFDGVDDVLESANFHIGCATAAIGMRIDSTNGPWVGFLGRRSGTGSDISDVWNRESSNGNFQFRETYTGTLADSTHFWRNKVNQDKNFTANTIEVYSADGTGRAAGAITFGNTTTVIGSDPSDGSGNSKIDFYGLILAGSSDTQILSAADRHTAEDYIASKSGAY